MSYGTAEAYRALAQQAARQQKEFASRRERIRERVRGHGEREAPAEALACPRCLTRFALGGACPDCDEPLVCASLAEAVGPERARSWRHALWEILSGGVVVAVTLGAIVQAYRLVFWLHALDRVGAAERMMMGVP